VLRSLKTETNPSGFVARRTTRAVTDQKSEVKGQRSAEPLGSDFQDGQDSVRLGNQRNDERGDEDEGPAFEFCDSSVGFAGLGVDFFEFFVDAVEALLAAVGQSAAAH